MTEDNNTCVLSILIIELPKKSVYQSSFDKLWDVEIDILKRTLLNLRQNLLKAYLWNVIWNNLR